jgi:hypothetical protein
MKFDVRKNGSSIEDTYDVSLEEKTKNAVRKTAQWTALTATVLGIAMWSEKRKAKNRTYPDPE